VNQNKKQHQKTNRLFLLLIILTLSFGFNSQSLAQNVEDNQSHANKIKISADATEIPSYLKHSKKAQNLSEQQQQKKTTPKSIIGKMFKALFLAIALFFGLVAILIKNKDKFKGQTPISLAKTIKQDAPNIKTESTIKIQPEIISADKQIRNLVFDLFNLNK